MCGNLPFGGAEEDADVCIADGGDTGGNGFGFHGVIDHAENDGVTRDLNEHATAGEVGDDFVFLGASG